MATKDHTSSEFLPAFESWLTGCQAIINAHHAEHYANVPADVLSAHSGKRYIRIVAVRGPDRSVYCFVDRTNGDVLKSASWKAPAKIARGNIFDTDNGLATMGPYGAAYLR